MQSAPKYSKIELYDHKGEIMETHQDCGMFITAETLVIVEDSVDSVHNNQVSEGILYKLSDISRYKTYKS